MYRNMIEGDDSTEGISGKTIIAIGLLYLIGVIILSLICLMYISALAFLIVIFSATIVLSVANAIIVWKITDFGDIF